MGFNLSSTSSKIFDLSEDEGKGKLQWEVRERSVWWVRLDTKRQKEGLRCGIEIDWGLEKDKRVFNLLYNTKNHLCCKAPIIHYSKQPSIWSNI